jgi:PhzF family phenazine biosynthesis protein
LHRQAYLVATVSIGDLSKEKDLLSKHIQCWADGSQNPARQRANGVVCQRVQWQYDKNNLPEMFKMENASLEYYILDVFTNKSYHGNPLSVVFTNGNLEMHQYENIAREFGYSETSFVYYAEEQKALLVRSFTPTGFEVHGAGHNLLGAVCAVLAKGKDIFKGQGANPFVIMKDAPIPLFVSVNNANQLPVVKMKQRSAVMGKTVPVKMIADALGLTDHDVQVQHLVPTIVTTEVAHIMVPVKSLQILNDINPINKKLIEIAQQYQFEGCYCFALPGDKEDPVAACRFFNPLIGIDEDAATGTAAGPLAGFLFINNLIESNKEYRLLQGVKLNQPSLIEVMVKEDGILVGGSSIITMQGKIYI